MQERATDRQLLEQAREEPSALGVFYDRYEAAVLAYFVRRTHDSHTALELAAETFAEVVLQCHRGTEVREPAPWLFSIAHAKLADFYRRGAVEARARTRLGIGRLEDDDDAFERIEALLGDPRAHVVHEALAGLPEDQRQAVLARVVDERDYDQIAAAERTSEQTVRKRVSRGLAALRRSIKETS